MDHVFMTLIDIDIPKNVAPKGFVDVAAIKKIE